MTLGEVIVNGLIGATLLGVVYAVFRYDIVNPREAPGYSDIREALKRGKPLSSQWKPINDGNRAGYGIFALCLLVFGILLFTHRWLIEFIDRL